MTFDVIVIGGGHAGAEATRVAARGGLRVAMITMLRDAIGRMSCNPAIGGLAKGHLVKELDALGGLMPEATDASGIQFRLLNRSKGPAVQGPRAQCDKEIYAANVRSLLEAEPNVTILQGTVASLQFDDRAVTGVALGDGTIIRARAVIVTTGTFLRALMHSGETKSVGGRFGEPSAETLSDSLRRIGLKLGRLKTGTPPRVFRDSVDFSAMELQAGDVSPRPFSILTDRIPLTQVPCHLTYTGEVAHNVIRANLHRAPMYSGQIQATGPRYCPSIEDKVVRFADKERHHVFVEPEGLDHPWLYLNGISTSLPGDVQDTVVRSLPGFGKSVIARYGYAVEYDFANPEQLRPTLEIRGADGLFLAGQINGTSGYEEAAAQGFVAGANALLKIRGEEPLILRRDEAYVAVMIDDLVTLGTEEPYRMFTSRAEHRLLLGCDTVYDRLTPLAERMRIIDRERLRRIDSRRRRMAEADELLAGTVFVPDRETQSWFASVGIELAAQTTLARLLQRADFELERFLVAAADDDTLSQVAASLRKLPADELEGVVNCARYAGYVARQQKEAERLRHDDDLTIPLNFSYARPGLSREIVEKLSAVRPVSIGQAARIRGITPAAIAILRMHLKASGGGRRERSRGEAARLRRDAPEVVGEDQSGRAGSET